MAPAALSRNAARMLLRALLLLLALAVPAGAQDLQAVLQQNAEEIESPGRRTVGEAIDALLAAGAPGTREFLNAWANRNVWRWDEDGRFYLGRDEGDDVVLSDIVTRQDVATIGSREATEIRPNAGVQRVIASALVRFQLEDEEPAMRRRALEAIERSPDESHLEALMGVGPEPVPALAERRDRLVRLLTIVYGAASEDRVAAIESFSGDSGVDVRASLNPLVATRRGVGTDLPEGNIARELRPGSDALPAEAAYALLVDEGLAPPRVTRDARDAALIAAIADGQVAGVPVATLDTEAARDAAYDRLAASGDVPPLVSEEEFEAALDAHVFWDAYVEADAQVTAAAQATLDGIARSVGVSQAVDLGLDALSLASIYFLAAIGLAITFGVMGVINMAHGEFIMMGAYTGYVVQQFVPNYTASIVVALPLAFAVTFAAGVAMERLVIRWLYHRPLETLLATFGISIALQQIAKNIFGTQARPLTSPDWLAGSLVINDVISISYIRVAIFFLALAFLVLLLFILNRTRLGLEVRAVTQNPGMAASMGIDPDRINMLTFGLGSGIAGIAGVAIGLFAQVTSEIGQAWIVQSFMTVVVGGVGNLWGTLAGATLIGGLQKGIEWLNPSNTLAAQTYMVLFVILFIQFRPRGLVALRGRAAGD